jgi:hypothetical protein
MANIFATLGRFFGQKVISAADEFADILDNLPNTPTTANRSRALTVENAPLIAHHNISPEGLYYSDLIGGIPSPSIAISRADQPLENFGDISLILDPNTIDPAQNKNMFAYPADAFTGRQPKARLEINEKMFYERLKSDPDLGHIKTAPNFLASQSTDEADRMLKTVQAAIDQQVINPKDYDDFYDLYAATQTAARNGEWPNNFDSNNLNQYGGLADFTDLRPVLPPRETFYASGGRRPSVPYTLEAGLADMRRGPDGPMYKPATEEYSGGPGKFRASMLDPFKNLQEIKDARGQIVIGRDQESWVNPLTDKPDIMDEVKEKFAKIYFTMQNDLRDRYGIKDELTIREFLLDLGGGKDLRNSMAVRNGKIPIDDLPQIEEAFKSLKSEMQTAPTDYFEVKPNQALKLRDFSEAVVPSTAGPDVIKILEDAGLPVTFYKDWGGGMDKGVDNSRKGIMRGLDKFLFSVPAGATLGYGALEQIDGQSGGEDGRSGN